MGFLEMKIIISKVKKSLDGNSILDPEDERI